MGFRAKLIFTILAAVTILGALNLAALQRTITRDRAVFATHRSEATVLAYGRLADLLDELVFTSINLSKPREIVNALATADNEALSNWGHAFVGTVDSVGRIDAIGFIDVKGMVVARAPDEFRFGDDLSASAMFDGAVRHGAFRGIAEVDGRPSLVAARTLRKYDDMPVGVVYVALAITPRLLTAVTGSGNVVLSYTDGARTVAGDGALPLDRAVASTPISIANAPGRFDLAFLPDEDHASLLQLQESLSLGAVGASVATMVVLLLMLRRQLRPYDLIIGGILEYANHATSLSALRDRLETVRGSDDAAAKVAGALIRMIDSLDASFRRIEEHTSKLEVLARADPLTTLFNRRAMDEALESELRRKHRYGRKFSVILCDIDHFKAVNDDFGHPVGDRVLHRVADAFHAHSRATDVIGRWGGEEFLLLCPDTRLDAAAAHAEKLRAALEATAFPEGVDITASFGVAECLPSDTLATLVARADRALYRAKSEGRNAVRATASADD